MFSLFLSMPNYEDTPTTTILLQINLPWWCLGMSLDQVKYTYPCLPAFIMTEHWLKQSKMLPSHIAIEWWCQKMKMDQLHHKTSANKPPLTGVGMSLDQVKYTYPCLPTFIMTEHWLKQPKMLPCHIAVKYQTMKMHQPPQYSCKYVFPDWCRNEFGSSKICLSMFTSFYYDWTLAEAAKNAAFPATLLSSTKLWRCNNHHETPADKPSLTGVGMNLGPVKYAYPCLPAFIMTEHWLKQPKLLALLPPCCWVKNMKMQQTPQNSFK